MPDPSKRGDWARPCPQCGAESTEAKFQEFTSNGNRYRRSPCNRCTYKRVRKWKDANPEVATAQYRRGNLKRRYGISIDDFDRMLATQDGHCGICRGTLETDKTHVDHNHHTGKVRALLCANCNVVLGMAYESPTLLRRAAEYLELHND